MPLPDYNTHYNAEIYDAECQYNDMDDLTWLRQLCAEYGGPVLEVCIGTGRVAIPLAYDGLKVTGIDLSDAMLDRCGEKLDVTPPEVKKRVTLVKGDMRRFDLKKKFRTVFIPFNSFLAMETRKDQVACLNRVREHLQANKGRFILDVFNPRLDMLARDPKQKSLEHLFTEEGTGIVQELMTTINYNDATQVSHITCFRTRTHPDGTMKRDIQELRMRMIFPDELLLLLEHCGFKVLHRWGSYERENFGPGMGKQLIVAKIM